MSATSATPAKPVADATVPPEPGRLRAGLSRFFAAPLAVLGAIALLLIVLIAIFAPALSPQDPYDLMQLDIMDSRLPPGSTSFDGAPYNLGTDGQGRDILSAL